MKDSTQLMAKPSMRSLIRYLAMHKMGTLPDEYLQEVLQLPYNSEQAIANEVSKSGVDRDLGGQMPIWVQFAINVSKSTMDLDVACKLFEIVCYQSIQPWFNSTNIVSSSRRQRYSATCSSHLRKVFHSLPQ